MYTVQTLSFIHSGGLIHTFQMLFCCSEGKNLSASPTGDASVHTGVPRLFGCVVRWLASSFLCQVIESACDERGEDELSSSQLCFAVTGLLTPVTIVTWPAWEKEAEASEPRPFFNKMTTDCTSFHTFLLPTPVFYLQ